MIASPEGFPVKQGVGTGVLSVRRRGRGQRSGLTAVTEHARGTAGQESGSGKYLGSDPGAGMSLCSSSSLHGVTPCPTPPAGSHFRRNLRISN